ncbi:unnamed protein product, partial [Didymodactylos carnosus]
TKDYLNLNMDTLLKHDELISLYDYCIDNVSTKLNNNIQEHMATFDKKLKRLSAVCLIHSLMKEVWRHDSKTPDEFLHYIKQEEVLEVFNTHFDTILESTRTSGVFTKVT